MKFPIYYPLIIIFTSYIWILYRRRGGHVTPTWTRLLLLRMEVTDPGAGVSLLGGGAEAD